MAYCPKCKTEYEDHIQRCVDCDIELVPDLENYVFYKPLIKVKKTELDEMLKYLEYSGIKPIEVQEEEDGESISVSDEQYEMAMTYLKVYIHEHMEETNEDDYYFDEYESEEVDTVAKVSDMKSTVYTFAFVGAGALVIAVLNFFDILVIKGFDKTILTIVLGLLGIAFIMIAVKTARSIGETTEGGQEKEARIKGIVDWYEVEIGFDGFYERHEVEKDNADEGALYFLVFDILKKEVKNQYKDLEQSYMNAAIERIYEKLT